MPGNTTRRAFSSGSFNSSRFHGGEPMSPDLQAELQRWSARLREADLNGWTDTADLCRRRIDHCLDRIPPQRENQPCT